MGITTSIFIGIWSFVRIVLHFYRAYKPDLDENEEEEANIPLEIVSFISYVSLAYFFFTVDAYKDIVAFFIFLEFLIVCLCVIITTKYYNRFKLFYIIKHIIVLYTLFNI